MKDVINMLHNSLSESEVSKKKKVYGLTQDSYVLSVLFTVENNPHVIPNLYLWNTNGNILEVNGD